MRVLVLWSDRDSSNLGVRVLAEASVELARQAWGTDVEVDFQNFNPNEDGLPFAGKVVLQDLGRRSGPLKQKLQQYDVILDTGAGDSFADIYGLKRLAWMVNIHRIARQLRIPVVLTPQTIGPFNTVLGRLGASYSLRRAALVQVRDLQSYEYSVQLGREPDAIATDMAFLLPQPSVQTTRDVILNVSGLLWSQNPHVNAERYRDSVLGLARSLVAGGARLTLLAHVLENPSSDSDASAVNELAAKLDSSVELLFPNDLTHARQEIASSKLLIGARMHACLNALSTGVPAIPWAYSRKFKPLFDELGWNFTVDLRTAVDPVESTLRIIRDNEMSVLREQAMGVARKAQETFADTVSGLAGLREMNPQ